MSSATAASAAEERQAAILRLCTGKRALLIIDIQNDFCPGGSLAVEDGDSVIPLVNALRETVQWDLVVMTQDWHPRDHASFASNNGNPPLFSTIELPGLGKQVMWPDHCVQETPGAEFHKDLRRDASDVIVRKGKNPRVDSYSGFGDAHGHAFEETELASVLKAAAISDVFVAGLATDYCVSYTCKDARLAGFNVFCLVEASKGIAPDTIAAELAAMTSVGVHIVEHADAVPTAAFEARYRREHPEMLAAAATAAAAPAAGTGDAAAGAAAAAALPAATIGVSGAAATIGADTLAAAAAGVPLSTTVSTTSTGSRSSLGGGGGGGGGALGAPVSMRNIAHGKPVARVASTSSIAGGAAAAAAPGGGGGGAAPTATA